MDSKGTHQGDEVNGGDKGPVYINPIDILEEIDLNDEDLPDANESQDEDDEVQDSVIAMEEVDDSIHTFIGHHGPIFSVACHPIDPSLVATGGADDIAYLWRAGDGLIYHELRGHTDSVTSLEFSADGLLLASGGCDGVVNVWDSASGDLKHKLEGPFRSIEWLQWHPKGHLILAGSYDFTSWLWNADVGLCLKVFTGHCGAVTCGGFTPDGKLICTGSEDGSLRVWSPKASESIHVVKGQHFHSELLTCLSIADDSNLAITGSLDAKSCLVNIGTGKVVGSLWSHSDSIQCVGFLHGHHLVASGALDGKLIIWDLQSLSIRNTCQHEDGVLQFVWSPTSQVIYSGCSDGKVRLWDPRTGNCECIFQGHVDKIQSLAISSTGKFVLSGSDDHTARIFETYRAFG
ncbi:hypothetical protein O6H91_03G094200 [Diphasiastrum complanatum]|uniref:Uncharacterized protein n=1 Tax=Diphasiastrum complanatum TaxID=34168 RepID=A0ACC2E960_DIPCM|nr:hypothetical protein O6H91_03G094200 [Diphasiastrum complanatum]